MSSATTPGATRAPGRYAGSRDRFRAWRQDRPFWGCVLAMVGGFVIYVAAAAPLSVVVMQGLPGLLTVSIFLATLILGGVTLYQPHLRSLTGLVVVVMGPLSIPATNLGGFVVGMILLVVGGGMMLAWAPAEDDLDLAYISGAPLDEGAPETGRGSVTTAPYGPAYGTARDDGGAGSRDVSRDARDTEVVPIRSALTELSSEGGTARPAGSARPAGAKPKPRPGTKRPAPRTGLAAVLDTMFGARRPSGTKPGQKRKPPPGKRPAGKRPPGAVRPGTNGRPGSSGKPGSSGTPGSPGKPSSGRPSSGKPSSGRPGPPAPSSLDRPADPPSVNARSWIAIPILLLSLTAPALIASPASAAPVRPASDGLLDWLFPPTPAPTTPAPTPSAPAPTPTPGFVWPTLPALPALPGSTPSATPAPATPPAPTATCPKASSVPGATSAGTAADAAAAAMKACVAAAAAGDAPAVKAAAAASTPTASNDLMTLKASRMTMEGFSYAGVATIDTAKGPLQTLHFSASSIAIEGMDQTYPFVGGTNILKNAKGTATLKGNVELYVTSFKSNVFGLIPLTFSVDGLQPPLVLPSMFFTDATSIVSLVTCDQILLPDLKITIGK